MCTVCEQSLAEHLAAELLPSDSLNTALLLTYSTRAENGELHYILCCCRDHTLHTLHEVYEKRRALNLEAITLMVPQVTRSVTTCIYTTASDLSSVMFSLQGRH